MKDPLPSPVYQDALAFAEPGRSLRALVQPLSGSAAATLYGEEWTRLRLMLAGRGAGLAEGMGVCVERTDGVCDYRVCAPVERWGAYERAILKTL